MPKIEANEVVRNVLEALEMRGRMSEVFVRHSLKLACWLISNEKGKGDACENWSVGAAARRRSWAGYPIGSKWPADHGLVHEHIVPRKWIEDSLFKLEVPTAEAVRELLDLSETCLVTEDEDKLFGASRLKQSIPTDCSLPSDKWLRYERAGVRRFTGRHPLSDAGV